MIRKWLLSMFDGEERILPASKMKYQNVKASTSQMKTLGHGVWKVRKQNGCTRIKRLK